MRVFVNYRTGDATYAAVLIDEKLCEQFGKDNVFRDNRSIGLGVDFRPKLWGSLAHSDVLVVVIGPRWLTYGADETGAGRRLDDLDDFVRCEIALGLRIGIRVVPVLIGDTPAPRAAQLPDDIADLAHRQYLRLHDRGAHHDVARLVREIADEIGPDPVAQPVVDHEGTVAFLQYELSGTAMPSRHQRERLRTLVHEAAGTARLVDAEVIAQPDGLMVSLPSTNPSTRLTVTFVRALAQRLETNTDLPRLRVAMDEGLLHTPNGLDAADRARHLLGLPHIDIVFKRAEAARLVLVLSETCFVAARQVNVDRAAYAEIALAHHDRCWLHVPGYSAPPGLPPVPHASGAPERPQPRPPAPRTTFAQTGGIAIGGDVHGSVYNGDRVTGTVNHYHHPVPEETEP
ncbi:toll/interleukin-1 receptor domain-containing protein [Catellatospora tritici]|uniref:toll/interleukin-1 receptor domain-containing protein n=1 Tax=Catellatospora tritici TaxID=2851566 RepID=UPI001C2DA88B|nr:toll/interleukin-1 receptor domain-containing protein [Catellatospora tritici]MBV1850045.1 toll/interleukin-1 receptor domain-containing protein [Catellatospora tritici]